MSLSLRVRALTALILVVLFPPFVLGVVLAVLAGGLWLAAKTTPWVGGHLILGVVPVVAALFVGVRDLVRARRPEPVPGMMLTRETHPGLVAEVDDIARVLGQPPPDRIVVLPVVNAFVTESSGLREMMVGYPRLAGLTRVQLRAVLAHEMGHLGAATPARAPGPTAPAA